MEDSLDEFELNSIQQSHNVAAETFIPFVIARLQKAGTVHQAQVTVKLRGLKGAGDRERLLRISWSPKRNRSRLLGVQENTVTEWAALGVACIVVSLYAGLRIESVARPGEGFDYWATDGKNDYGLEVSGTMVGDLESRHRAKVRQLLASGKKLGGFVVIVDFGSRTVILSYSSIRKESR